MRGRNDEMKRIFRRECFLKKKEGNVRGEKKGFFEGKPMVFLCKKKMNIYAKQEEEMDKYPKQRL